MKKIILISSVFIYIFICILSSWFYEKGIESYDRTVDFNREILQTNRNDRVGLYSIDTYNYGRDNVTIMISTAEKIDDLIKENNIKNTKNINYKVSKYNLPIENEDYQNLFKDFTKEKRKETITKDKNGNDIYDISPDTIIVTARNGDITEYLHIDNRLVDTRNLLNKTIKIYNTQHSKYNGDFEIKANKKSDYSRYNLSYLEVDEENNK